MNNELLAQVHVFNAKRKEHLYKYLVKNAELQNAIEQQDWNSYTSIQRELQKHVHAISCDSEVVCEMVTDSLLPTGKGISSRMLKETNKMGKSYYSQWESRELNQEQPKTENNDKSPAELEEDTKARCQEALSPKKVVLVETEESANSESAAVDSETASDQDSVAGRSAEKKAGWLFNFRQRFAQPSNTPTDGKESAPEGGEEQLHTLSSPSYSAADCEKECDEVDDILGGAASREVNDQGDAVNSIPQHLPPRAAGDTAVVEDRMNALLLKEDSHLASLHTKLRENGDIIATEMQLNEVVLAALERIFDPQQPKYNLLPDLANSFIKALTCNDNVNKALSLEHKAISLERSKDVIGLSEGMTWGAIAFKVAEMTSENDGSGKADLPEHITSLLEDARTAVSKFDNTNTMKLENFAKFGMNDKIRLGILVSLAMMQVVLSELTIRQLSSDSRASLEWRKSVEELWKLVCPELEFNADVRLSEYFVAVVRPGLNSVVEEIFELSSDVTHATVKVLTLTKGTKAVREKVRGAYKKSQSRTADGRIDESSVDYCAGDGELHSKARNRMVTIYFLLFVLDVLMRKKLGQEMTRKSLLHKLLITGQDQIRLAFNQSVFNMKQDLRENQLANIRKLLEQKKRRKAIESRMLLIDSEEQITSMQNILAIAKPNHD